MEELGAEELGAEERRGPALTLVDLRSGLADAAEAAGWTEVAVMARTDMRDVPLVPGTAFLSPANSIGEMSGGIDELYSRTTMWMPRDVRGSKNAYHALFAGKS